MYLHMNKVIKAKLFYLTVIKNKIYFSNRFNLKCQHKQRKKLVNINVIKTKSYFILYKTINFLSSGQSETNCSKGLT